MDYDKYFQNYSGDKGKLTYLIDKVKLCQRVHRTIFTDFLTPEEQLILKKYV